MKSSLPILFRLLVLVCPFTIWSQSILTVSAVEISAPPSAFNYVKLKGSDDVNVQYYLTTALAVAAGYDHETAISVGLYNQLLDDQRKTSSSPWLNFKARRQYHFTSAKQREKLWRQFEKSHDVAQLSMYLHALQDSYYHQGFWWVWGHLLKGHKPDQSWLAHNFAKNKEVAHLTYLKLLEASPLLQQHGAAVQFENISGAAAAFLQANSEIEKGLNFRALCHRITEQQAAAINTENALLRRIQQAMTTYESNPEFRAQLLRNPADCLTRLRASASLQFSR
jgi:hypothetical protein